MNDPNALPPIGGPALRALADIGIHSLDDLRGIDVRRLATLHGVGPKAVRLLTEAQAGDEPRGSERPVRG